MTHPIAIIKKVKAVITDLDGTLWDGVLAEQQPPRLRVDYYNFLNDLHKKGVLLFVATKNDERDLQKTFVELGIDPNIFVAIVANWDPKYLNVEKLLRACELRPETVVFIDDNPAERREVEISSPQIFVLADNEWPVLGSAESARELKEQSTTEIETRINRYKTALAATKNRGNFKEDIEFLHSLHRTLSMGRINVENLDRFTRLLVETHRINFNPGKFAKYEEAIEYLHSKLNDGFEFYAVSAKETDFPLGLTGAIVLRVSSQDAEVVDAAFSCGIIGRDFENKALLVLIEQMKERGLARFFVVVALTETNRRVRDLLTELGFGEESRVREEGMVKVRYSLDLKSFVPKTQYEWIKVSDKAPELDYTGHPAVINFFESFVRPLFGPKMHIANVGSAHGEVLGFLDKEKRSEFQKLIEAKEIVYTKVDMEFYPDENNLVANAENLKAVVSDASQDIVMAVELLEHTEHFWFVVDELIRICKVGGYIFVSVPSFDYPKHEYPIDQWRIGPKTLKSFFPSSAFEVVQQMAEGRTDRPRRSMILVKKLKETIDLLDMPKGGETNWQGGLTIFE